MERLTLQMKRCLSLSVYLISQERMPNGRHVHPNLVGSSRLQAALDIGIIPKTFQHLIMCDSLFSIFLVDRHPLSVLLVPADGRTYCPLVLFYHAVHDGAITPVQGMRLQLLRYPPVRRVVFTDDKGTRRVSVDLKPSYNI